MQGEIRIDKMKIEFFKSLNSELVNWDRGEIIIMVLPWKIIYNDTRKGFRIKL